jgi:hypothetical protein
MFSYEELGGLKGSESWLLGRTLACRVGVALYEVAMRHLGRAETLHGWPQLAESDAEYDGIICPSRSRGCVALCDLTA